MKRICGKTKAGLILITLLLMSTLVSATRQQVDDELLNAIEESSTIKTRDLSKTSGIGGTKLKEILNYLVREGLIKEHISNEGVGRPGKYYSTVQ